MLNDLPDFAHILFCILWHTAFAATAGTAAAMTAACFLCCESFDRADMLQEFQLPPDIRIRCMQFNCKLFDRAGIPVFQ